MVNILSHTRESHINKKVQNKKWVSPLWGPPSSLSIIFRSLNHDCLKIPFMVFFFLNKRFHVQEEKTKINNLIKLVMQAKLWFHKFVFSYLMFNYVFTCIMFCKSNGSNVWLIMHDLDNLYKANHSVYSFCREGCTIAISWNK